MHLRLYPDVLRVRVKQATVCYLWTHGGRKVINQKRTNSFKNKSPKELAAIAASGSLGAAAAQYALGNRSK